MTGFLVVPSIRENCLQKFLKEWQPQLEKTDLWNNLIVVEDNPFKTFKLDLKHHYAWQDIEDDLKEDACIISRRDSAIRSYGFLTAYRLGADYTITLDDDCYPEDDIISHIDKMHSCPKWSEIILGMRTRGLPYKNLGKLDNVVANIGLWSNVPDYDSIQMLSKKKQTGFKPPKHIDRILPIGQYTPICGMNLAFKREVAVLTYFPLMGENSPYHRFDDIWFGIIFKKICDHLNLLISCGHPIVKHSKASDPFINLVKEAPGLSFNENFWEIIDNIHLTSDNPKGCMEEVGNSLKNKDGYVGKLGKAILTWIKYF